MSGNRITKEKMKEQPKLNVITPDRRKHSRAIYDLFGKSFPGGYWDMVAQCRQGYFARSHYDWDSSRIGMIGDELVTHFGVWGYRMRIGTAQIRCAGIGAVMTHGEYRKRGYMAATIHPSLDAIAQAGYDVSILFGRRDFYHKYGYLRAWASTTYTIPASEFLDHGPAVKLTRFAPKYRPDLDRLYNREYAAYTGTAVRPTYRSYSSYRNWRGYLWNDAKARPAGYVIARADGGGQLELLENAGKLDDVLAAVASLAGRWRCSKVSISTVPHDHPLAKWARRGNCQTKTTYVRSGKAMIRTMNLRSTLEKISDELARRLAASHMSGWRGRLSIRDARQSVVLAIQPGKVRVAAGPTAGLAAGLAAGPTAGTSHAIRGGEEIAQLLIGTDSPDEITQAAGTRLTGDGRALAEVLFAAQHPVLSRRDSF